MFIRISGQNNNLSVAVYALHIQGLSDKLFFLSFSQTSFDWPWMQLMWRIMVRGRRSVVKETKKRPNCKKCCQTIRKGAKVQDKWQERCGKKEREWFFFSNLLGFSEDDDENPFFSSIILNNFSKSTIDVFTSRRHSGSHRPWLHRFADAPTIVYDITKNK